MRTPALAISPVQTTLLAIKKNLAGIKTVTSNSFVLQQQQVVVVRKQKEEENRRKKESKTEAFKSFLGKKTNQLGNAAGGKGSGILDYIKNFASFVFWGFLLKNLLPHLPKLKAILPLLSGFFGFLEGFLDLAGNVIVNFIDAGYKAYDSVRGLTKSIGGEKFQKTFDDFSKHFNTFLNLAIFGGLAAAGTGLIPKLLNRAADKGVEKVATSAAKKGAAKITTSGGRVVSEVGKKAAPKFLGKAGKFGGKILGKSAPVIGPLINFGIRVWSGDNPGRAAAGSVGMGVGQAIGGFLGGAIGGIVGSVVPILGNALVGAAGIFVGQLIGGLIGEWIGDSLYDLVNKKPGKVEGRAKGGQITRNGVPVGGKIRRGVRPQKQRLKKPTPKKSNPGRDVGGIKKIEKLFPNPEDPKKKNPLKTLKYAATAYNTIPGVGRLLRAGVEGSFGERPDKNLIKDFSNDIGVIVQNVVNGHINTSSANILAMASGGLVPERTAGLNQMNVGEQVSTLLAKSLDVMMNNQMNRVFQNIMKQYDLEDFTTDSSNVPGEGPPGGAVSGNVMVSSDNPDFWLLATAAMFENSDPQGAADVAQVIYNRVTYPAWGVKNYREAILKPGQFTPVSDYGGAGVWNLIKDKNTALAHAKKFGKTQAQLESVAAALLDPVRQNSARTFVGPRDGFRSVAYEAANNHLADDTEVRRHGHVFGFEPGGALIGQFRAGKLKPAEINKQIVSGSVQQMETTGSGGPRGQNGRLPASELMDVGDGQKLWKPAAQAYLRMKEDAKRDKVYFRLSEGYRTLETQKAYWANPPSGPGTAARPGTSKHGWGKAIDISSPGAQAWIRKNGRRYGWIWPDWAQKSPYEPWHFEYIGGGSIVRERKNQNFQPIGTQVMNGDNKVSADIKAFRNFRRQFGAPAARFASSGPQNYQIREMGIYGRNDYRINPMADDTNYEIGEHQGVGHHENRAFDIPVPRLSAEGDRVAQFWRDRGYKVIWREKGHDTHVHVEVPRSKTAEFFRIVRDNKQRPKGSGTAARISAIPTSSKMQAQSIARYDTTTERTNTVVAYQQVIQPQLTPVPVKSKGALFPGDSINVNNNSQYQSLGIA